MIATSFSVNFYQGVDGACQASSAFTLDTPYIKIT